MKAQLLIRERIDISETAFVEMVVWRVPQSVPGSRHSFKYRLALVSEGSCVLRYDNEAGKGDHKHIADRQAEYHFTGLDALQEHFWADVLAWRRKAWAL
jgi:hypothetical protein